MILIVGLGNPDKRYENTRHNVGFTVADNLADGKWQYSKKFKAEVAKVELEGQDVILLKPQTYMNKSGESVRNFVGFLSLPTDRVWIIHDDLDLELGKVRVRASGSAGGHRGVLSVISSLGTEKFARFRVGIKTPMADVVPAEDFVLQRFNKEEKEILDESIEKTVELIKRSLKEGVEHVSA